jgi:hypothetical protein
MKRYGIVALLLALVQSPALAQGVPPDDLDLVVQTSQALGTIAMPLAAHQQTQNVIAALKQQMESRIKERAEAKAKAKPADK